MCSVFASEFHAYVLERGATSGVMAIKEVAPDSQESMEDCAIRFGQKLGQWAVAQAGAFGLLVGVHSGSIEMLKLPNSSSLIFYGEPITAARGLADSCPQRGCVHLLKATKDSLNALECLQFSLHNALGSFYVEPSAEVPQVSNPWGGLPRNVGRVQNCDSTDENGHNLAPEVKELMQLLCENGIDVRHFAPGALEELYEEIYVNRHTGLEKADAHSDLVRTVQLAKVWICAGILATDHVLLMKSKISGGKVDHSGDGKPLTMRVSPDMEWEEGCAHAIHERLGLDQQFQAMHFRLDVKSYKHLQEMAYSKTYPGLKTIYNIHEVRMFVINENHPDLAPLGLPSGGDYVRTTETKTHASTVTWSWRPVSEVKMVSAAINAAPKEEDSNTPTPKRRLPAPQPIPFPKDNLKPRCMVAELMKGKSPNWPKAMNAAKRIRDPAYSLHEFYADMVAAFPELALYVSAGPGSGATVSGNTADEEYQRTMGALFAVFWMMRLHLDGAQSFCFGVDDGWKTLSATASKPVRTPEEKLKRQSAMENLHWEQMELLLVDAGILTEVGPKGSHNVDRTLAMLVLTAIHDIMKITALVPVVQEDHGTFRGYKAGEPVGDHDAALGYVLELFQDALPSYAQVDKASREVIKFTQSKMEYNMGWLVQAEATPGALFRTFKETICGGGFSDADVSFYFVHWLTDLAGAEPCPLEGCEKFVLKFPQKVLVSFLRSFNIIKELAASPESEVYENYLAWRWRTHDPALGPVPEGSGSIAKMRLVVMAQGDSSRLLEEFEDLSPCYIDVLSQELARTGCANQVFNRDVVHGGPAIMVYYGPALLQQAGSTDMAGALFLLAEVYTYARELFPIRKGAEGQTVCIRIDAIKNLKVHDIRVLATPGEIWILEKTNSSEAQVRKKNLLREGAIKQGSECALFTADMLEGLKEGDLSVMQSQHSIDRMVAVKSVRQSTAMSKARSSAQSFAAKTSRGRNSAAGLSPANHLKRLRATVKLSERAHT
eukprot:CAMPEP_0178442454 /NCGR_PEP_ID=MMETSP0689_2-20121128/38173_1 /TAXON_ID=160604 /ORGANISM="Amphidinium massartii, Strain CS-259" /LENGTH=1001 /DNA_ID=CAMNT_0020066001 /DNA_START=208 /DNA_END=3213 /DNA_ORIENTATION=+